MTATLHSCCGDGTRQALLEYCKMDTLAIIETFCWKLFRTGSTFVKNKFRLYQYERKYVRISRSTWYDLTTRIVTSRSRKYFNPGDCASHYWPCLAAGKADRWRIIEQFSSQEFGRVCWWRTPTKARVDESELTTCSYPYQTSLKYWSQIYIDPQATMTSYFRWTCFRE